MIVIEDNLSLFLNTLEEARRQYQFAAIVAATRTAKATVPFLSGVTQRVFDRPTPFTVNAFWFRSATNANPVAEVGIKDFASKGTPAIKYLRAEIFGGTRRQKRSEKAFARTALSGNRGFWVPGPGVTLDAYGNVPGSVIRRILSDVRADGEVGYLANRTARSVKRNKRYRAERYFVPTLASGLAPGVWVERPRGSRRIMPALLFVTGVSYTRRFDFFGEGMGFARLQFPIELERAVRERWHLPKQLAR